MSQRERPARRFEAVFLDFDGVLVDSETIWWAEIEHVLKGRGLLAKDARIAERVTGLPLEEALRRSERARILAPDLIAELAREIRKRVEPRIAKWTVPTREATAIRRMSDAAVIGVVSSSSTALLRSFLLHNALDGAVSVVVGGDRVRFGKPAPDIYFLAANEARVEPRHCCVAEDSEAGLQAAWRAGMYPVQYGTSREPAHDMAATKVCSIVELAALVLGADSSSG